MDNPLYIETKKAFVLGKWATTLSFTSDTFPRDYNKVNICFHYST